MNYGVILAGGIGSRIKNIDIPKQYYKIDGIPIIIYTLRQLLRVNRFDYIYIAVAKEYMEYMESLLLEYVNEEREKITVLEGGKERIDTIHNVINKIENDRSIGENDVIVIHDAVRPFVTEKILNDSIEAARKYGAVVATVPMGDTVIKSMDGQTVDSIPTRSELYKGQAPDSFKLQIFIELESKLTEEQKKVITGTSQVCTMNQYPIWMISGDDINFKITTDSDMEIAEKIILSRK